MLSFPQVYPTVKMIAVNPQLARHPFAGGAPKGIVVHYSADPDFQRMVASDAKDGYCYHLVIDRQGMAIQTAYFDKSTWHAGKSAWGGYDELNAHFLGVCLLGWGRLQPAPSGGWQSWAKAAVPDIEVARRPANSPQSLAAAPSSWPAWQAATQLQEAALEGFCRWAIACGLAPSNICGHDEAALPAGRKEDPGGMLSWPMATLRANLATQGAA